MIDLAEVFLAKAEESLEGAESEFANGRYNNCASRCYYACFQAAIRALVRAGITPRRPEGGWGHPFVQAAFASELIQRQKLYQLGLRGTLSQNLILRRRADYEDIQVSQAQASRALRRTRSFLAAIR